MTDFEGADVLVTRFQGDAGEADPRIRELIGDPETYSAQRELVDRLAAGRLLIPVVAHLDEEDADGGDKHSHMSTVTVSDARGRKALVTFTGVDSVAMWRADARPIPVAGMEAARAALQEGCDALLIDIAGPTRYALAGTGLWALAAGGPWRHPLDEPEVAQALADSLAASRLKGSLEVDPSTVDGVALVLTTADYEAAQVLAQHVSRIPAVQARVSRLEIRLQDR
ncbi:MAG: SseB family protein [Candidatus Nanopelagicales bacterium]